MHDPGFNLIVFVSVSTARVSLLYFLNTGLTQGIYPTLIIILISKQMSPIEHYSTHSTYSTEMLYTSVPTLGPLGDGSKP